MKFAVSLLLLSQIFYFFLLEVNSETYVKIEGRRVSHISYGFLQLFWIALLQSFIALLKYDTNKILLLHHHD